MAAVGMATNRNATSHRRRLMKASDAEWRATTT
jgi:hypothetical protein